MSRQCTDDANDLLRDEDRRVRALTAHLPVTTPDWIIELTRAADQFLVARHDGFGNAEGASIIAGYPWFTDWSRDTMLSLTGITLGRPELAAKIITTYATHLDRGMLPNRFLEDPSQTEFNSVDAALLFIYALGELHARRPSLPLIERLMPSCLAIVENYLHGTRHGIRSDPDDGLISAGEPGVQLTWMDAKVGDWVVTPRCGKPVEINALWYNALRCVADFCRELGRSTEAARLHSLAESVRLGFRRYWNAGLGCLYDVLDGPESPLDDAIRPNQILAIGLPYSPLEAQQAKSILEVCAQELFTPVGLRSLSPRDAAYRANYGGGPWERDGAYHQGTVWTWPLGFFIRAHLKLYGDPIAARSYLDGIRSQMDQGIVGSVGEIFDAEPPHAPRGCYSQAWSVAEVLHAWDACQGHTGSSR
ncbi:MAG: hypothetical protein KDD69_01900 [Bdellovibrionales bacterium]|nr:hypothetical protein [Bdellovibrionales bacterium]